MTATHSRLRHPQSPPFPRQDKVIGMYDDAIRHLGLARHGEPHEQKQNISTVVKILSHLKEASETAPPPGDDGADLPTLYGYMIDRLSISHSGLGIDPINEVNWLLQNLKELSAAPKTPEAPTAPHPS